MDGDISETKRAIRDPLVAKYFWSAYIFWFLDPIASPSTYPCQWGSDSFRFGDSYRISKLCKLVSLLLLVQENSQSSWNIFHVGFCLSIWVYTDEEEKQCARVYSRCSTCGFRAIFHRAASSPELAIASIVRLGWAAWPAGHCITFHMFYIGMSSSHLYIGSVMMVNMLHHGASNILQGHVRRDFVRGAESPHWGVLRLATNYFAIWKIWKYSWAFLQKRLKPGLLLGLKPLLCSIVVMWPSQLNQLTSAFLAPATMSNKPGLPRMLMTPHLIH